MLISSWLATRRVRRTVSVLALIFLLSLMGLPASLVSVSSAQSSTCPSNDVFHWFIPGGVPSGFNLVSSPPSLSDFYPARLMYESFQGWPFTNGTIFPADAITSSVTHNSNYTQWTFAIKPGLKWSNGQPVTANDILATYGSGFGLNASFDVFNFHQIVTRAYALNPTTAVFDLNVSDASFPAFAGADSFTGVYPVDFTQHGGAYAGFNSTAGTLIGDGPFYASNYASSETQMSMLRNPYYSPMPGICQLVISFVESDAQDATYLVGGQADLASLEPGSVAALSGHSNLHIFDAPAVDNLFLGYNESVFPYNQLAFRQALEYGINQTEVQQKAYFGYFTPAYNAAGGVPPQSTLWYNPHQVNYTYNPTQSLSLLHSLGYTGGTNGAQLKYPNGTAVSLAIYAANEFEGNTLAAGVIQNDLKKLGMTIDVQSISIGNLVGLSYSGALHYGMQLFDSGGPVHGNPYLDALPEWNVYTPTNPYPVWEPSPTAEASYQGNLTCVDSSDVYSVIHPCLNNIQNINSQQLPNIMLGFPDILYGYSTAHFTNWPPFIIYGEQSALFNAGLAQLQPVGVSTTTTTSLPSATTTTTTSPPSGSATTTTTTPSSTTTTTTAADYTYDYIAAAVVIIIVIAAVGLYASRRRGKP